MSRMEGSYNACPKSILVSGMIRRMAQRDEIKKDPKECIVKYMQLLFFINVL